MTTIVAFATPERLETIRAAADWRLRASPETPLPDVFWRRYKRDLLQTGMPSSFADTFRPGFLRVVEREMRAMIRAQQRQEGDGAA